MTNTDPMLKIVQEYETFRANQQFYSLPERKVLRDQFRARIDQAMLQ